MKKYLFVLLAIFIAITSCSKDKAFKMEEKDGVKNFTNNGTPSVTDFDPELKLLIKISGTESDDDAKEKIFSSVADLVVDSEQSIYIADTHSSTIKKFDANGKFIKSFGGLGNGPGEYQMIGDLSIFNDTINVFDQGSNKLIKFDRNGKFQGVKQFAPNKKPIFLTQLNKDKNIALNGSPEVKDGVLYFPVSVQIYDSKYNEEFSIENRKLEFDLNNPQINPTDLITPFCFSDKNIFTGEVSENLFKYKVYDMNGKLTDIVKLNYKKTEVSKDRIKIFKGAVTTNGEEQNKLKRAYNKAVEDILCDKFDRIWVKKAKTDESVAGGYTEFNIFKDGIYLNNYKFNGDVIFNEILIMKDVFYFIGDKLYVALDDDGEVSVNVYEYE